jgi:hypothetical protein
MNIEAQIDSYIGDQPEPKRDDMRDLHRRILGLSPDCRLWFLDGRDDSGKIVSNPNIGYGSQTMTYADGKTREFYRIGVSANTTGISVYVMGLADKNHLSATYGQTLGKASITGYCIKFKRLADVHIDVLEDLIGQQLSRQTIAQ